MELAPRRTTRLDAISWLTLYTCLLLFVPSRLTIGPLGSAGAPSMLFGLASLLLWGFLFLTAVRSVDLGPQPIRIALGILLFCIGVSYVLAMSRPMSPDEISPADVALLGVVSWTGTLLLTHDGIHERSRLDVLVWRLAVCGGLIALLGLVQIATRQLWVDQLAIPGLISTNDYGLSMRGSYPRPSGTSLHPIEYGVVLTMLLPIVLHVGFHHTHRPTIVRWLPAAAVGAIIPLTSSRSAYLGALVAMIICITAWPARHRLWIAGIGTAGVIGALVVAPRFLDSVIELFAGADEDPSIASRTNSFSLAFEFIASNPWFGRGLGTFLPKYRIFDNQYLLLLVTVGVVGTAAFLALAITAVVTMLRLRRTVPDDATRDLVTTLAASICAGFVCLFMFDAFAFPMSMGTLFLLLGMAGALRRIERTRHDSVLLQGS
ncbi:MAG: O-antigen ligase family protein [Microbacterium sp.]